MKKVKNEYWMVSDDEDTYTPELFSTKKEAIKNMEKSSDDFHGFSTFRVCHIKIKVLERVKS